jgi:hypothetical protein
VRRRPGWEAQASVWVAVQAGADVRIEPVVYRLRLVLAAGQTPGDARELPAVGELLEEWVVPGVQSDRSFTLGTMPLRVLGSVDKHPDPAVFVGDSVRTLRGPIRVVYR